MALTLVTIPKDPSAVVVFAVVAADFPLTVSMDTLMLPVSVVRDITDCSMKKSRKKSQFSLLNELDENQEVTIHLVRADQIDVLAMFYKYVDRAGV